MKQYVVTFSPRALTDLHAIRSYFTQRFDPVSAAKFAEDIVVDCLSLAAAPHRGTQLPGRPERYRMTGLVKGRVAVAFEVGEYDVKILALRYGGFR